MVETELQSGYVKQKLCKMTRYVCNLFLLDYSEACIESLLEQSISWNSKLMSDSQLYLEVLHVLHIIYERLKPKQFHQNDCRVHKARAHWLLEKSRSSVLLTMCYVHCMKLFHN